MEVLIVLLNKNITMTFLKCLGGLTPNKIINKRRI